MCVINPWVFYLMHVADGVVTACVIAAVAAILGSAFYAWYCVLDEHKLNRKALQAALAVAAVAAAVAVFIPNSNTVTRMIVAQNVTCERVEEATDAVQKVDEEIMSLVEEGG